jgi:hypothetical protein
LRETEFREAVQSGLGRAFLYAQEQDVTPYRDIILDACLHCYSVDEQFEGTRAPYMYRLISVTREPEFYRSEVLNSLSNAADDVDTVQRFRIASYWANDGDLQAREALYANFKPGPRTGEHTCIDLLDLDGVDGFLHGARAMGSLLLTLPDQVDSGLLLWHATEAFGEERTFAILEEAAKSDVLIEAYRSDALAPPCSRTNELGSLRRWSKNATDEELERAAIALRNASDPREQLRGLAIFSCRAFPGDPDVLQRFSHSPDERVAGAAFMALSQVTHASIRPLAFHLTKNRHAGRVNAIAMLTNNYEPGDYAIAAEWFRAEQDRHGRHYLGLDLWTIGENHPDEVDQIAMLLLLYERTPCSSCRNHVVRKLIERGPVPDAITFECMHDADDETQKLFKVRRDSN